jgi:SAM-dependent methyltransferase
MSALRKLPRRALRAFLRRHGYRVERLDDEEWRYLETWEDPSEPLPADAAERLRPDHPRLRQIESLYAGLDLPVLRHTRWSSKWFDFSTVLPYFRGDTPYVWHYRERRLTTQLKYFIYLNDIRARDRHGLLQRLREDGAFGCWSFDFPGYGRYSRDLLDSANEIDFLDRHVGLLERPGIRVLDIGAGYGRLAHRFCESGVRPADYACCDAVPISSFLSEYYLGFRGICPPARTVLLDQVGALQPGQFDLAINVHSFSECASGAIAWWLEQLRRLRVPQLFLVPNEGLQLLSTEMDGSRGDFSGLLAAAGYRLKTSSPVIADAAARELVGVHDHMMLFQLQG